MMNISQAKLNTAVEIIQSSARINITSHQIATAIHGKLYRIGTTDKPKCKDGWFNVYYGNRDFTTICYGNWSTQQSDKYHLNLKNDSRSPLLTSAERKQLQAQIDVERMKRDQEIEKKRTYCVGEYKHFKYCYSHDYLTYKGINYPEHYQLRLDTRNNNNLLCIPFFNQHGILQGYQSIDTTGKNKIFRGSVGGYFWRYPTSNPCPHVFNERNSFFVLCEGLATGLSVYEAINEYFDTDVYLPILLCAFNVGNLDKVITATKGHKLPYLLLVDNDSAKPRNAGIETAKTLLNKHSDCAIYPLTFTNGDDANDYIVKHGTVQFIRLLSEFAQPILNQIHH